MSGYLMKASGFAGGGEGGGASAVDATRGAGWLAVPAILGLLAAVVLGGAVVAERRRLRAYAEYDAARPRPFAASLDHPKGAG